MSPLPDIRDVPGEATRNDEDGIDPDVVARPRVTLSEPLGGNDDASKSPGVERHCCGVRSRPGFHLDECKYLPAPRDDIDLAARHPGTAGKNPPAVKPKPPAGERLGTASTLFSRFPIHFERSRARA